MNVKVFVVDDHPMLRKGLRQALAQQSNVTVVGEASRGGEALKGVVESEADVVVMDVLLPDMNGIEVTRQILSRRPSVKVIMFSGNPARSVVDEALEAGACGYVWKQSAVEELGRAIEMVRAGKLYLSPEISAIILENYRNSLLGSQPSKPLLSQEDKRLLKLIAEGHRSKEIAGEFGMSLKSVEAHRSRLMKKLDCSNSAELVRYAIREGIISA